MAEKEQFTYENIRQIHIKEMKSSSLTRIDPNFYENFFEHLSSLENEYRNLSKSSPDKPETVLLAEEIRKLRSLISSLYERRERKIIFLAQVEARGGRPNTKNLAGLEKTLYEKLVSLLKHTRSQLEGSRAADTDFTPTDVDEQQTDNDGGEINIGVKVNSEIKPGKDGSSPQVVSIAPSAHPDKDINNLILVRIIKDNITFQDEDSHKYYLKKEDVVTLPPQYAQILVKRGAAKIIEDSSA
jgi:DNA replication initiation complex subunit (GINS family)